MDPYSIHVVYSSFRARLHVCGNDAAVALDLYSWVKKSLCKRVDQIALQVDINLHIQLAYLSWPYQIMHTIMLQRGFSQSGNKEILYGTFDNRFQNKIL